MTELQSFYAQVLQNNCFIKDYPFSEKETYNEEEEKELRSGIINWCMMSEEEKENLQKISSYSSKYILNLYEEFNDCSNFDQADDLKNGFVSSEGIYEFAKKEKTFIKILENEIKRNLLERGFIRLSLEYPTGDPVLKKVLKKANMHFIPVCLEFEIDVKRITIRTDDGDTIDLTPKSVPKVYRKSGLGILIY